MDTSLWFHFLVHPVVAWQDSGVCVCVLSLCLQTQYRTHQNPVDSAHRITPTLIALIVLFTLLVTPSHLLVFVALTTRRSSRWAGLSSYRAFEAATNLTNFLLLCNFAVNFLLYLVVNADFRRVTRDLVT